MSAFEVIIIGAGAAGLMCAIEAGKRGRKVLVLDHSSKAAEKIRISGGGRCNFTNINTSPKTFISNNPHFCVSALSRYTPKDFIELVKKHKITYHEKTLGQLFCDNSSQQIIDMLLEEGRQAGIKIWLSSLINKVEKNDNSFSVSTNKGALTCESLVIATGGKSIPKMGATGFGYEVAKNFGINIIETRAGLVPFTCEGQKLEYVKSLAGVSVDTAINCGKISFSEAMLFTHRGLSGPAILQISSYWQPGNELIINLAPTTNIMLLLKEEKNKGSKQDITTIITKILPKRLAQAICDSENFSGRIVEMSDAKLKAVGDAINHWQFKPSATEGYRTAEVTLGGVDTNELSSKTFETKSIPGLYFIGEVVDVTGHLGGYNFQWAWSSGFAAGQYV